MSGEAPSFADGSGFSAAANGSNAGKKAVHVKWAGKTIALGTFPAAEADEKCARAKALTRAWRSTMRPKPTRDWVMVELERLGVRVVSGRLGRKAGEDGEDDIIQPTSSSKKSSTSANPMAPLGMSPSIERSGSMGWGNDGDLSSLMNRRTSMGLSMMNDGRRGSLGSLGPVVGLDSVDPALAHRQLGGGFDVGEAQRRASSLGLGTLTGGGLGGMGLSVNPNQHYEMLKLHHMNLLNEIQETTLMMNLYQQQQLQQQQQQLQQQATVEGLVGADPQLSMMHQQNVMDPLFGAGKLMQHQRGSLGVGGGGNFGNPQMQLMQHQMLQQNVGQLPLQHQNPIGNVQTSSLNSTGNEIGAPASSGKKKTKVELKKKKKAKEDQGKEEPKEEEEKEAADEDEDDDDDNDEEHDDDDNDDEEDLKEAV